MDPYETNCLVVDWDIMRDVFGDKYWNEHDGVICVPTNRISDEEYEDLFSRHNVCKESVKKAHFLIAEL